MPSLSFLNAPVRLAKKAKFSAAKILPFLSSPQKLKCFKRTDEKLNQLSISNILSALTLSK